MDENNHEMYQYVIMHHLTALWRNTVLVTQDWKTTTVRNHFKKLDGEAKHLLFTEVIGIKTILAILKPLLKVSFRKLEKAPKKFISLSLQGLGSYPATSDFMNSFCWDAAETTASASEKLLSSCQRTPKLYSYLHNTLNLGLPLFLSHCTICVQK